MQIFKGKHEIRDFISKCKALGKRVGFVPTMGYLHQGHLSLMQTATKDCEVVVASIFVNPTQFGPKEDFSEYPRDFVKDCRLLEAQGVDALFYPEVQEMYGDDFSTWVEVSGLGDSLCGKSRPGHFRGVATVVTKLFNIIQPDSAYFGQKDAQQSLVIKRMAQDLDLPVKVVIVPTVREKDGLAMSSRNVYLTPEQRAVAPVLYSSLQKAEQMVAEGEREIKKLESMVIDELAKHKDAEIDYVEIRSLPNLEKSDRLESFSLMALAVRFGQTRLIDNIILEV
ncbi:MAG: pantoate--beta-alanine ligase [Peptococcaceae bacterium]|nr:pantoate--beta-alanine ligase [Peptococcaceae bacterium]